MHQVGIDVHQILGGTGFVTFFEAGGQYLPPSHVVAAIRSHNTTGWLPATAWWGAGSTARIHFCGHRSRLKARGAGHQVTVYSISRYPVIPQILAHDQ